MHPANHAARHPDKPAIIMGGTGSTISFAELDARSNQSAHLLRALGLKRGNVVATVFANAAEAFI